MKTTLILGLVSFFFVQVEPYEGGERPATYSPSFLLKHLGPKTLKPETKIPEQVYKELTYPEPEYTELPPQYVEPPPQYVEPPPQYVEPPPKYVEPPPQYVEPPPQYVEPPPKYVEQHQPKYVEPPPKYVEQHQPQYQEPKTYKNKVEDQYETQEPDYKPPHSDYQKPIPTYEEPTQEYKRPILSKMPSYPISFPYINHPQYLPNALTFTTGLRGIASSSSAYIPVFAAPGFALGGTGSIATSGTNQFTGAGQGFG